MYSRLAISPSHAGGGGTGPSFSPGLPVAPADSGPLRPMLLILSCGARAPVRAGLDGVAAAAERLMVVGVVKMRVGLAVGDWPDVIDQRSQPVAAHAERVLGEVQRGGLAPARAVAARKRIGAAVLGADLRARGLRA